VLKLHHLGHSQSERIVWLLEELELPYELVRYTRDPITILSPPELKQLHPLGEAPLIEDGELLMAESAAIVEYIIVKHGSGRLRPRPEQTDYAEFLYWFHFSNGSLQPEMGRLMALSHLKLPSDNSMQAWVLARLHRLMAFVEARLGESAYLAGDNFTAADIMIVFSLTTMRLFQPLDLEQYPHIRAYLIRIGERPAYRRALAKGDPDLTPMLR